MERRQIVKKLGSIVMFSLLISVLPAQVSRPDRPDKEAGQRVGILLLAHGGNEQQWDEDVRHVADRTDLSIPTEVAFGMARRSTMQAAVNRLVQRKVTEIVAVPLFISSHSSLMDSIRYLLGLRAQSPSALRIFAAMDVRALQGHDMDHKSKPTPAEIAAAMAPVQSPAPILMAPAFDHHRIVADILRDRAASISRDPAHEVVILVAHGPVSDAENALWLHDMSLLADQMKEGTHYAAVEYLTLRDDAEKPIRNAATRQLRSAVKQVTKQGDTALIVPLLVSYGGIEGGLRKRLDGLKYRMPSQALLPDHRIVNWVLDVAENTAAEPPAVNR